MTVLFSILATTTAILPSQCTIAVVINDPTRLTTAAGSTGTDTVLAASYVWYRFASPGGTQLATSPPAYLRTMWWILFGLVCKCITYL